MTGRYRNFNVRPEMYDQQHGLIRAWKDRNFAPNLIPFINRKMYEVGFDDFVGITTDGTRIPDLFPLERTGQSGAETVEAAIKFLATLTLEQRRQAELSIDATEARNWFNGLEMPYGVPLRSASQEQREAALNLMRSSFSQRGYEQIWATMQVNEVLGEIVGDTEALSKWNYGLAIFGTPSTVEPWGWQIQGHHVVVNVFMVGDQVVVGPCFIGAEPAIVDEGPLKGLSVLEEEEKRGRAFLLSLNDEQRSKAIIYSSMIKEDLPSDRTDRIDERIQSGGFRDNAIIPYEGISAKDMTQSQRRDIVKLVAFYLGRMHDTHAAGHLKKVGDHLNGLHFAWIGGTGDGQPFYYKIHSPVILIEFDHHAGIVLDNNTSEKFHAHSQIRIPNGGDYGRALIDQHRRR